MPALATAGLRALFGTLGRVAPAAAGGLAERLFFTPPRSRGALAPPGDAEELDVAIDGRRLAAWRCGDGPAVLLMHGWGGSSAQLGRLVPPLLERGFSVVALDGPAHGRTPGRMASLPEFARALAAVARASGTVHAIVGHSLGAAAAALAVAEGLPARRLVLVGAAADPLRWAQAFAARFHVPAAAMRRMGARSERRLRFRWSDLHLRGLLRAFSGDVLFIHDRDDRDAAWTEPWALAQELPGARFVLTSGLGHRRILGSAAVARLVAAFVATGDTSEVSGPPFAERCDTGCGRPAEAAGGRCIHCALDEHLFQRETARFAEVSTLG